MRRLRRPLVWLPLVVSTLFFAACGWHNAHLQRDERRLWLNSALYATSQISSQTVWALDVSEKDARNVEQAVKGRYNKKVTLVSIKTTEMPSDGGTLGCPSDGGTLGCPWFAVQNIALRNRFYATTQIIFGDGNERDGHSNVLTFTRSPLKFWDDAWHLASIDQHPH